MNRPQCGRQQDSRCPAEPAVASGTENAEPVLQAEHPQAEVVPTEVVSSEAAQATPALEHEDSSAWRGELSARLSRYRARRRVPPPRYPSLRLGYNAMAAPLEFIPGDSVSEPSGYLPMSDHALALDGMAPSGVQEIEPQSQETGTETVLAQTVTAQAQPAPPRAALPHGGAKIIEFPRYGSEPLSFGPPVPPPDQLAEPVMGRPRILEVPEFEPAAPALGGITIEPAQRHEAEKRPGIDIPLQTSSLSRRIFASLIDGLIVVVASVLFGVIFWKVTAVRPPQIQMLALAAGMSLAFWAAYQYLLLVYSATTLGLLAAGLELARFDGSRTTRSTRRWRVLASYLSAASLGMGYAWVFLDEDVLCWHDRITHTYLATRIKKRSANQKAI
jgi:uncharacterized RDD family membrane protein YckC